MKCVRWKFCVSVALLIGMTLLIFFCFVAEAILI